MLKIKIKTSHSIIIGEVAREDENQWILCNVTIQGIKEVRQFEGYSVPKRMTWSYEEIKY